MQQLLILMYHQVYHPSKLEYLTLFESHLEYLTKNFNITTPGGPLDNNRLNVCLTFDDAYADFYFCIYPLLKKYKCKAVLGIPTSFIQDETTLSPNTRLAVPYPEGLHTPQKSPLCTWAEIKEMVASQYVIPASHSHTHANLREINNAHEELAHSQALLQEKLQRPVDIFIYPFGAMNTTVQQQAAALYKYCLRIGAALNRNWQHPTHLYYRIDADALWHHNHRITTFMLLKWTVKFYINYWRKK